MLRAFTVVLLVSQSGLPVGIPTAHLRGTDSTLKRSLAGFRGYAFEAAFAWTWENRVAVLIQYPLSDDYHIEADIRLSYRPWRSLACVQPEFLPLDPALNAAARKAEYLIVTQAPAARECVANRVLGSEIVGGAQLRDQLAHSRVVNCRDVEQLLVEFEVPQEYRTEIMNRLKRPLPWDYRLGPPPEPELLSPDAG